MVDVPLKKLRQGMIVAQSVYNSSGASYLSKGMSLTAKYIEKLKQLGVAGIHVVSTTPGEGLLPPDDVLRDETRAMAVKRVYDVFQQITKKGTIDPEPLTKASSTIVNDIIERKNNLVQLTDLRAHDMYTFAHSVNVAMLSALLATLLNFPKEKISELTLGALLHDLGKTVVPTIRNLILFAITPPPAAIAYWGLKYRRRQPLPLWRGNTTKKWTAAAIPTSVPEKIFTLTGALPPLPTCTTRLQANARIRRVMLLP